MAVGTRTKRTRPVPSAPVAALSRVPVGAGLAQALAGLDLPGLTGYETVLVLKARNRQGNHERGLLLTTVAEVLARTDAEHGRRNGDHDADINEVRAALMLSRRAARSLCGLAQDLIDRLPTVLAAMTAGRLDQPRARIFSLWTQELDHRHAHAVVDALLPHAHTMSTGQLIEAIQKAAIELDPQWARRRYEKSLHARWVEGVINHDGTADLTGHNLPADEVAAACDRLDALARQVKDAGHPGKLTHIRADIFLGRHDRYIGLTDDQLLAHLIATIPTTPDPAPPPGAPARADDHDTPTADKPNDAEPDAGKAEGEDGEGEDSRDDEPHPDAGEHGTDTPADDQDDGSTVDEPDDDEPDGDEGEGGPGEDPRGPGGPPPDGGGRGGSGGAADPTPADPGSAATGAGAGAGAGGVRGRGLRLLVGLSTLAGLDHRPGELLGSGYLHAELAARVSAAPHAAWYLALVRPDGTPIDVAPIRTRPTRPWYHGPPPSYTTTVEVWLQVTPAELVRLVHDPPPGWHRIVAALAHRLTTSPGGAPNGNPDDRLPGAALRRWLAVRDRRCTFPGCRVAPHHGEIDHTIEHGKGGPTLDVNLASTCGPDHTLRHDGGWHVAQPAPGRVIWTSPLGHSYHRTPPPGPGHALNPLPEPTIAEHEQATILRYNQYVPHQAEDTCKFVITPPPPEPEPPPPPPPRRPEAPPF